MAGLYKVNAKVWFYVSANSQADADDMADDRLETAKDYFDDYEIDDVTHTGGVADER